MATTTTRPTCWLDYEHPEYARLKNRWTYAMDHYTGEVVLSENLQFYLEQRQQGEANQSFQERARLADYTNHFAALVDSIVGMAMSVEANATRVFATEQNPGLGDPKDLTTPIGKLYVRCDDEGNSYPTVYRLLGTYLTLLHRAWGLVDAGADDETRLRYLDPRAVRNWYINRTTGILEQVLVVESADDRGSIEDDPAKKGATERYVLFTLEGWSRWRKNRKGDPVRLTGPGSQGSYRYVTFDRQPTLPIYPVALPLRRMVGWSLAKKANVIFNAESARDHLIRVANFPKLNIWGPPEHFKKLEQDLIKGSNLLHNLPAQQGKPHEYTAPPTENAKIASDVLQRKVEEFYITGFREYSDAAREKTATEVRQDLATGIGAFLQLFKAAMDDGENQGLWRIAQREYPDEPARWFVARAERSDDFAPMNPETVITNLVTRAFGTQQNKSVPLDVDALFGAAKEIAQHQGLPVNEARLKAAIRVRMFQEQSSAGVTMPAELRADYAVDCALAQGRVDERTEVELEDGTKITAVEQLRQAALELAQQEDQRTALEAQHSIFPAAEKDRAGFASDHNGNGKVGA